MKWVQGPCRTSAWELSLENSYCTSRSRQHRRRALSKWCPDPPRASVPEPATLGLLTIGFAGAGFAALRRKRKGSAENVKRPEVTLSSLPTNGEKQLPNLPDSSVGTGAGLCPDSATCLSRVLMKP